MNISLSRNSLKYHSSHSLQVHLLVCCAAHDNINYAAVGIILTVSRFYRRVKCNMQTRRSNESPAKEQIQCVGRDAIKLRRKKAVSSPHLLSSVPMFIIKRTLLISHTYNSGVLHFLSVPLKNTTLVKLRSVSQDQIAF